MLYWSLKVAVPQTRGGRVVERGGWVGGILDAVCVCVCLLLWPCLYFLCR